MQLKIVVSLVSLSVALGEAPASQVKQGTALSVAVPPSVRQIVSVQAVMLPYNINRELFSKHIADNYAVVVVNIGNRSHDAALVMQGIYLDYSKWALSGNVARPTTLAGLADFSAGTFPGQVSSVEYRVVRGELEERDVKTIRNWVMRSLEFAGSLAGGTTFAYGAMSSIPKYISMATGVGIPGFEKLWPDALITKLNRISDFGYRVNRTVPRESSDMMIAFFPIDRFLTPKLKKIFVKQPALFFNTGLALMDPNPEMTAILERVSGKKLSELTAQIPAMIACSTEQKADACDQSATLRELVRATSLNSIEVVIDGTMMLDVATVPPVVSTVVFQDQAGAAAYWTTPGSDKGIVITGQFLDGARVAITPADAGIEWVSADPASTSGKLVGKLKFGKAVPSGQALSVRVVKDTKDGQALASSPAPYTVSYAPAKPVASDITAKVTGRQLTLTGTHLGTAPLSISMARDKTAPTLVAGVNTGGTLNYDLKSLAAGCYAVILFTPDALPLPKPVVIAPAPLVTKATRTGNTVHLDGSELFAMADDCTLSQVTIAILDDKGGLSQIKPTNITAVDASGTAVGFDFPFPGGAINWQVQVTSRAVTSKPTPVE